MANTPIYTIIESSQVSGPVTARVRDASAFGTVEETVTLTEAAPRLWTGTITGSLTGDKYCDIEDNGSAVSIANAPHRYIHNLLDNTANHFMTPLPPVPHYSDVRRVGGAAASVQDLPIVYPAVASTDPRAAARRAVVLYTDETPELSLTVFDSDLDPVDLSGKTLVIVIETADTDRTTVAEVEDADLTVGGDDNNVVTFDTPADVTSEARTLSYAVRDAASPRTVWGVGTIVVRYAPEVGDLT